MFSFQPGTGLSEDVDCTKNNAFLFNDGHLVDTSKATFYSPGSSTPRTQCGDLTFNETSGNPGKVVMHERLVVDTTHFQAWGRRSRQTQNGTATEEFDTARVLGGGWVTLPAPGTTNHLFDVPALDFYDIVAFAYRHAATAAVATSPNGQVNAKAQLWRHIDSARAFSATALDGRHVRLGWTNAHLGRAVDSTEVWRNDGSLWLTVRSVSPDSEHFTDSVPVAGVYRYSIRHVGNYLQYSDDDVGALSRPNSAAPHDIAVTVGAPAPTNLNCEGNFDPRVDCTWTNAVPSDSVDVYRGGQFKRRLGAGTTAWTDSTVTLDSPYVYRVAHYEAGYTGILSAPDTTFASPVAPLQLGCSGLEGQPKVFCSWYLTEPNDSSELQRSTTVGFQPNKTTAFRLAPGVGGYTDAGLQYGTTYYYRVRHVRGTASTGWSNLDTGIPGQPDPLRPAP